MPLHLLPLLLTVVAVLVLGIVAVICSTTGGADWLQRLWKGATAAPGNRDGRLSAEAGSGTNGLAGPADALGDAVERADVSHRTE